VKRALIAIAVLGVTFQVGHFTEHAVQAGMWLFGDRTRAWMSDLAMWLSTHLGPMPLGMEVLHLLGNFIFLVTIGAVVLLTEGRDRWVRAAFSVELFHLTEHLMLTISTATLGDPIGWSTLFGLASTLPVEAAVGYRVMWHFTMNLIPSALLMRALLTHMKGFKGNSRGLVPMSR
jgi:hypothetical protein